MSFMPCQKALCLIAPLIITALLLGCANAKQTHSPSKNIHYNQQGQLLDLYIPKTRDKETAIMFIHGGGFTSGSKEDMSGFAKLYAEGGFVTTSINYRLTPKHSYPAAVDDVTEALNWMKKSAQKYGYNPNKIVVVGYSAGATLALNVGLDHTNNVAAVVSTAPVTDIEKLSNATPHAGLKQDLANYLGKNAPKRASPIAQVTPQSAPVFLFHGENDNLVPISHSVLLAKKLKAHKVPVLLRAFPDAGHEIMLPNKHLEQLLKEMTHFILGVEAKK